MNNLIRMDFIVNDEAAENASGLFALHVAQGWEEEVLPTGETRFRVYTESPAFCQQLESTMTALIDDLRIDRTEVPQKDWVAAWREFFTPVAAGKTFMVIAPWMVNTVDMGGRTPIIIEPKCAFGTGHHPTTALCLSSVAELVEKKRLQQGMRFLDLGTGSGILGIGCSLLGLTGVGSDIDMLSVENATENKIINKVDDKFEVRFGSTEAVQGEQYDVIMANILAAPLKELAPSITALLKEGGCLVLSGLLDIQADSVEAAYMALGMPKPRRRVEGEWAALIWE